MAACSPEPSSGARRAWGARRLRALVGALVCAHLACVAPPPPLARDTTPTPRAARDARAEPAVAPLTPGRLRVRLARLEGVRALEVRGDARGALRFEREGAGVVCITTGELAPRHALRTHQGGRDLELDGRSYPGTLWVLPDEGEGLRVENHVPLEDYVAGVVPSELILWSAKESEIEAQAIAARSYALRSLAVRQTSGENAFLWDDTRDQVYLGRYTAGTSQGERRVQARLLRGLANSRGKVLIDEASGAAYDVRFHAACGGTTCSPAEAFPNESTQRHRPVPCEPCLTIGVDERTWPTDDRRRRRVHWRWTANQGVLDELARRVGVGSRVRTLRTPRSDANGRWESVEVVGEQGAVRVSIERLRGELDPAALKSGRILHTWPRLGDPIDAGLYFEGLGRGHGAGLCQTGSHEYALRGWSARQILTHYLPGARIAQPPESSLQATAPPTR